MKPSELKKEVCAQLGISEFEYEKEVFESGISFLDFLLSDTEYIRRVIAYHQKFWAWWKNQFQLADIRLLNSGISKTEWFGCHSPEGTMVYPPSALFEETYEVLISEINKEAELCS